MKTKLTLKQKTFVEEYLKRKNATKAALAVYDTTDYSTASNIGSDNLRNPKIIAFLEEAAEEAAGNIMKLAQSAKNETVRLNANRDILDRAGYEPVKKVDLTSKGKKLPAAINIIANE